VRVVVATHLVIALALQANSPAIFDTAKQRYYEAVEDKRGALEESLELLAELHTRAPDDALVLAYYGSARLLEAAQAIAPWRKGKLAKEGLQMLDEAVNSSPEDLEIRFLRGISTFHLPGFFKRRPQSDADFSWLAARVTAAVAAGQFDRRLGAAALYHQGLALERANHRAGAEAAWREAARLGPATPAGMDARKKLAGAQP
jgi:tetratricopeptide (TPR) repeat protein